MKQISYTPAPEQNDDLFDDGSTTELMQLNGQTIGEMILHSDRETVYRYHAVLFIGDYPSGGLAQGHGRTKESAIEHALHCGQTYITDYHQRLADLQQRIRGEEP